MKPTSNVLSQPGPPAATVALHFKSFNGYCQTKKEAFKPSTNPPGDELMDYERTASSSSYWRFFPLCVCDGLIQQRKRRDFPRVCDHGVVVWHTGWDGQNAYEIKGIKIETNG